MNKFYFIDFKPKLMMKYEFQNVMTKMGVERRTELEVFRSKISECMDMVSSMDPHDRITVS